MNKNQTLLAVAISSILLSACGGSSNKNDAPSFAPTQTISLAEDTQINIPLSATDEDGDQLTYSLANAAANGVVTINAQTGAATYTPRENFYGSDSFQVRASDGKKDAIQTINLDVTPVNDAPTFANDKIIVSGVETKIGLIEANDIDEDKLTFSIVKAPVNGELTLTPETGEVSYRISEIVAVNDTVTISVSDGTDTVEQEFPIAANLATNADRAYHYYASSHSHLRKAEELSKDLADDVNQGTINRSLAKGYADAGFTSQADSLLTLEKIKLVNTLSWAKIDVANSYQRSGLADKAKQLRAQAKSAYQGYLADKGLNTFNADDLNFLVYLANSYEVIGDFESQAEVFDILNLLFSTVLTEEYNTAALRAFFAYRDIVEDLRNQWLGSGRDSDKARAMQHLDKLYEYALQIAPNEVRSDRNGNKGELYTSIRSVALGEVIQNYIYLQEMPKAKSSTADLLALYGVVNYDPAYPREADKHAEVTKVEYHAGIWNNMNKYVLIYPEMDAQVFVNGLPEGSFWRDIAAENAADAKLLALARSEPDGTKAFASVQTSRDEDNLRNYFTNLVRYNGSEGNEGLADLRILRGDYSGAVLALEEARKLIAEPAYIAENIRSQDFVVGHVGCEAIVTTYQTIAARDVVNQAVHTQAAKDTLKACVNLAQTHFKDGVDGTDVDIDDAISANSDLVELLAPYNMESEITEVLATAEENLKKLAAKENEKVRYANRLKYMATAAYLGGDFARAQAFYNRSVDTIIEIENNVADGNLGVSTESFIRSRGGQDSNYWAYLNRINLLAGQIQVFESISRNAKQGLIKLLDANIGNIKKASQQTRLEFLPKYAVFYAYAGEYDAALALMNENVLGTTEKAAIKTDIARRYARKDDFLARFIATVDTDGDGKPNFFAAFASDELIERSGLVLDEDSDNDGVKDEEDTKPLDPSVQ